MKKGIAISLLLMLVAVVCLAGCIGGNDPVPTGTPTPTESVKPSAAPTISVLNANASAVQTVSKDIVTFDAGKLTQIAAREAAMASDFDKFGAELSGWRGYYKDADGTDAYIYVYDARTAENADAVVKTMITYHMSVYETLKDLRTVSINGHDAVEVCEIANPRANPEDRYMYFWANGNAVVIIDGNIPDEDTMKKFAEDSAL